MSLIDEALKRAQASTQADASAPSDRPWVPAPMPDAGLRRGLRVRRASGIALLVIAAAGAVYVYQRRGSPGASIAPKRVPAQAVAPAAAARLAPAAPTAFPLSVVPTPPRARPSANLAETAAARPAGPPEPAAPARSRLVSGRTYSGAVELPEGARIELGGIVWSETEPRALLNDRIVAVGAYVEGFTVAGIETGRVELRKDNLTIFLSVE